MAIDLHESAEELEERVDAWTRTQEDKVRRMFLHQRISLVVIGLVFSAAWFYLTILPERPGNTLMQFQVVASLSSTSLCVGDTLQYQVGLEVYDSGVFDFDVSIWRLTPPMTVVFSNPQRVVFTQPQTFVVTREWIVPDTYINPATSAREEWLPGQYEIRFGLSTPSRSTRPSTTALPFTIQENCSNE